MAKPFVDIFDSFSNIMELLRNEKFQDLLVNYERAKKVFIVGYEVKDEVSSEILFTVNDNETLKPEDYLQAFSRFVINKEKEITAIGILLNRPKEWSTKALNELKKRLKESYFDEDKLEKAHKIVYHKDAVDIISMIKHAARETEPLLSPEERVGHAIQKVIAGKHLNEEQQKWMGYIREHLKQNMTLDEDDLKVLPVFANRGGLNKFRKVFAEEYKNIIHEINQSIAA